MKSAFMSVALFVGTMALQTPALSEERAGALEAYLARPAKSVKWDWGGDPPQVSVPKYQRMFLEAETELQKAVAIGNLSVIANQMALDRRSQEAGRQLNDEWVMPNLEVTRALDNSHTVAWRHSLLRARNIYRMCGDHVAERQCLASLFEANAKEGDDELAIYLLAYHLASIGKYGLAIMTIDSLPDESKWTSSRDQLVRIWAQKMNDNKNAN